MLHTLARGAACLAVIVALVACGGGDGGNAPDPSDDPGTPVRLEIAPGAVLLPPGATRQLRAIGRDAEGRAVPLTATFESSKPGVLTVAASGLATGIANGSAQIVARAGGLVSEPVLALVATPAPGVTIVPDSLAVGEGVTPVDTLRPLTVGQEYRVRLRGGAPTVGELLLGDGGAPIAGRVTGVVTAGDVHQVTLELRPLAELLPDASASEILPLDPSSAEIDPSLASSYRLEREGTRLVVTPTGTGELTPSPIRLPAGGAGMRVALDSARFRLGPFECRASTQALPTISVPLPSFAFDPALEYRFDLDLLPFRFDALLAGNVEASVTAKPRLRESFGAQVTCEKPDVLRLRIPIAGPLSLFVGGFVPLGGGFSLSGAMTIAQFGWDIVLSVNPTVQLGVTCTSAACATPDGFEWNPDATVTTVMPDITSQFRVNLEAFAYAKLGLVFGGGPADVWDLLGDLELLSGKAGIAQTADLAPASVQVADTGYASSYRLKLKGSIGAGEFTAQAIAALREALRLPAFTVPAIPVERQLSRSPSGGIAASPGSVGQGDSVTVTISLDTTTFAGTYAVDRVVVQRSRAPLGGGIELSPLAGPCGEIRPSPGQATLTCRAAFADTGEVELRAFVYPRLYGLAPPTPLELGKDVRTALRVTGTCSVELFESDVGVASTADLQRLANVRRITGNLRFNDPPAATVDLACLEEIGGGLRFENPLSPPAAPLQYLFSSLRTVGGDIQFASSTVPLPVAFDVGFPALTSVGDVAAARGGFAVFAGSGSVSRIAAPSLASIGRSLQLQGGQLREFLAPALQRTGRNIIVTDAAAIERLVLGPALVGEAGQSNSSLILARLGPAFTATSLDGIASGIAVWLASVTDNRGFSDSTARAFAERIAADSIIVRDNTGP